MRSLIIEKDPAARAEIKNALQPYSVCQTAQDRASALELFRESIASKQPFDLVTIDVAIPDMHEDAIITTIREIESEFAVPPEAKSRLVVITDKCRRQLVTDCFLKGCDDFIVKTIDEKKLLDVLMKFNLIGNTPKSEAETTAAFNGQLIVDFIIRKIKHGDLELPPAPRIAMRVRQLVGSGAEIATIVELLRYDLSISTKLISVSNSVAYGGVTKNTDVRQAVSRLGLDRTVAVVMSICCRGYFITNHPAYKQRVEALWWHSLACANATEMIIRERRINVAEDLFSLALLHDVGKLLLIQAAGELHKPKKYQVDVNFDALDAIMQAHHERFGVLLLQKWGYSKAFSSLIRQDQPMDDENASLVARQVLHQADLLAAAAGFGDGNGAPEQVAEQLAAIGYNARQQADLAAMLIEETEQLRYLFG